MSVKRRPFHAGTAGSLTPAFASARPAGLAVRRPYAFALDGTVSYRAEGTFERLRYSLGGDRPSQTVRRALSRGPSRVPVRDG